MALDMTYRMEGRTDAERADLLVHVADMLRRGTRIEYTPSHEVDCRGPERWPLYARHRVLSESLRLAIEAVPPEGDKPPVEATAAALAAAVLAGDMTAARLLADRIRE